MNILPHKSWHVRTKENIARVRKDEAKAAEEAKDLERRIKLADQEARTRLLRKKAQQRRSDIEGTTLELLQETQINKDSIESNDNAEGHSTSSSVTAPSGHVNFFQDLEDGENTTTTNKDREEEEKKEKEEYEKKIGLLTYLGQDSQELTGEKSWWQKLPENRNIKEELKEEPPKHQKHLDLLDPLNSVRKYLGCKGVQSVASHVTNKEVKLSLKKKKRKRKYSSTSSSDEFEKSSKKSKKKHRKRKDRKKDERDYSRKSPKKKSKKLSKAKIKRRKHSSTERKGIPSESDSDNQSKDSKKQSTKMRLEQEKRSKIERLRVERLEREKKEKARKKELLYGTNKNKGDSDMPKPDRLDPERKYNSQYNPQFAKQNKLDASKKYWLQ